MLKILSILFLANIILFANIDDKSKFNLTENDESTLLNKIHNYNMNKLLKQQFISLDDDLFKDYISNNININKSIPQAERKTIEDTIYLQGVAIFAIYVLGEMPTSISKWEQSPFHDENLGQSWLNNIKAGPIWDQDVIWINWIGHPVSGAWYYTLARDNGLDPFESFLYSAFLSTFVWEYGYESFAEIPSLQDLVLTPVVGAVLGEYLYILEKKIDKNNGKILGFRALGSISYFLINPFGNMANGISDFLGITTTVRLQTYQVYNDYSQNKYNEMLNKPRQFTQNSYGVYINFEF